jgi:ZIP family zinc transporter
MIIEWFANLNPLWQTLFGTLFTWFLTALGASTVFVFRNLNQKMLDGVLGFAAGVMIAVSFLSLLLPAIELAGEFVMSPWIPAMIGFLLGVLFLWSVDKVLPHLHLGYPLEEAEGIKTGWERNILLVLAITLHNIPEGLAAGVAFGALGYGVPSASLAGAMALVLGMGIQNFPEGVAVSMPLRREGMSRLISFWYGQLSGAVEPVAGVLGALAVVLVRPILPYALAFAAGAMIYVVMEELVPEALLEKNTSTVILGAFVGFVTMVTLDLALG